MHLWRSHATHVKESCHTREFVKSHTLRIRVSLSCASTSWLNTMKNEPCHTHEGVVSWDTRCCVSARTHTHTNTHTHTLKHTHKHTHTHDSLNSWIVLKRALQKIGFLFRESPCYLGSQFTGDATIHWWCIPNALLWFRVYGYIHMVYSIVGVLGRGCIHIHSIL